MSDAQSRSSLEQTASLARAGMAKWSRFMLLLTGMAVFSAVALIWSVPGMRAQTAAALVGKADPAPAVEAAKAGAIDAKAAAAQANAQPHSRTVAFLESMGDKQPARKLPVVKVSAVQAESLRRYIARKYKVSNEATQMLISTSYSVGRELGLDPLLLLAIIAVESSFNPFAESAVGAQGLMQVMTKVHTDKFARFGGDQAAWNPVANIRVGASILKEYVTRTGSLMGGLRMYVGVGPNGTSPYGDKVLAERRRLAQAAGLSLEWSGHVPLELPRPAAIEAKAVVPARVEEAAVSLKTAEADLPVM